MKKLKLKLDGKEMLSKDQMKKIAGGYGNGQGYVCTCPDGSYSVYMGDSYLEALDNAMDGCGCQTFDACDGLQCDRIW